MNEKKYTWKDFFGTLLLLVLALWLSPFLLLLVPCIVVYKVRRWKKRKYLLESIQKDWISNGKNVLVVYSESKIWKEYFEKKLIPQIENTAVILNWSLRHKSRDNEKTLALEVLKFFRKQWYYPVAFIFGNNADIQIFDFHESYIKMIKSGTGEYKKMEEDFLQKIRNK